MMICVDALGLLDVSQQVLEISSQAGASASAWLQFSLDQNGIEAVGDIVLTSDDRQIGRKVPGFLGLLAMDADGVFASSTTYYFEVISEVVGQMKRFDLASVQSLGGQTFVCFK